MSIFIFTILQNENKKATPFPSQTQCTIKYKYSDFLKVI